MAKRNVKPNISAARWMADARRRQGLPPTIEDTALLARLAVLLRVPRVKK